MGAADVVPGVSGGTIAFISGIYQELIDTINKVDFTFFPSWKKNGFKIVEVPVRWYYDGQSKVHVLNDSVKMFRELLQIRRNEKSGIYKIEQ